MAVQSVHKHLRATIPRQLPVFFFSGRPLPVGSDRKSASLPRLFFFNFWDQSEKMRSLGRLISRGGGRLTGSRWHFRFRFRVLRMRPKKKKIRSLRFHLEKIFAPGRKWMSLPVVLDLRLMWLVESRWAESRDRNLHTQHTHTHTEIFLGESA